MNKIRTFTYHVIKSKRNNYCFDLQNISKMLYCKLNIIYKQKLKFQNFKKSKAADLHLEGIVIKKM